LQTGYSVCGLFASSRRACEGSFFVLPVAAARSSSYSTSSCFFPSVVLILGVNSASQVTVRSSQRSFKYTPFLVSLDGDHQLFRHSTCFNQYTSASTFCTWYQQDTRHKDPTEPLAHDISRIQNFTNIILASVYVLTERLTHSLNHPPTLITAIMKFATFLTFLSFGVSVLAASAADWRSKSIYQVLTDR